MSVGDGWRDALDTGVVGVVLTDTGGHAWTVQAGAAALLVAFCAVPPRARFVGTACAASLMLAALALTGHAAVALSILTGAASTALVLGRWPVDLRSPYEALLDVEALAVVTMAGLATLNRYALVPRLPPALPALCRVTLAELPLGLLAVGLVAVFGLLDPG